MYFLRTAIIIITTIVLRPFSCESQEKCRINLDALTPKYDVNPDFTVGKYLKISFRNDLKKGYFKYTEHLRAASKKEIKKPEQLEERFKVKEGQLYLISTSFSLGFFRDTSNLMMSFSREEGAAPNGLNPVDKNNYSSTNFKILEINDEYIVMRSKGMRTLVYYGEERDLVFERGGDPVEMEARKTYGDESLIDLNVVHQVEGGKSVSTTIKSIFVDKFETTIRFEESYLMDLVLSKNKQSDIRILDVDCYGSDLEKEKLDKKEARRVKMVIQKSEDSIAALTIDLKTEYDEFKGRTFYYDKRGFINNDELTIYLYFSILKNSTKAVSPHIYLAYNSSDWLFFESLTFLVDDEKYTYSVSPDTEVLGGGNGIEELINSPLSSKMYSMFRKVKINSSVKLRLSGRKYYQDYELTEYQKLAIFHVLSLYEKTGGRI